MREFYDQVIIMIVKIVILPTFNQVYGTVFIVVTTLGPSEIPAIWQTTFWNAFSSMKTSLNFVYKGPNDNKSALVQVMVWWRTDTKNTWTNVDHDFDVITCHWATMS